MFKNGFSTAKLNVKLELSDHNLLYHSVILARRKPVYVGSQLVYNRSDLIEHFKRESFDPCIRPSDR